MINLNTLLPRLLRINGGNAELAVKLAWSRAVGAGLRRHTSPLKLQGKTLVVAVADAIWQRQLQQMSQEIIFRMNNLLGQSLVDSIVFEVKPSLLPQPAPDANATEALPAPAPTELLFAARSIADEDLRQRFIRAAANCIARRESHNETAN